MPEFTTSIAVSQATILLVRLSGVLLDITGPVLEMNIRYDGEKDEDGFPRFYLAYDGLTELKFFQDTSLTGLNVTDRYSGINLQSVDLLSLPSPSKLASSVFGSDSGRNAPSELQLSFGVKPFHIPRNYPRKYRFYQRTVLPYWHGQHLGCASNRASNREKTHNHLTAHPNNKIA